jgi:hypothetical protein
MFVLAVLASGCLSSQAPAPTPDPFAGLSDRSDQAFRQGLEAYGQGQYRDALTAFEQARTLDPTADARVDQMIARTKAAMAPTPTPVPPTPTPAPVVPTATPVAMSAQTPDSELGQRYFGKVVLAMVPGKDSEAPAATQFFYQDQIGVRIEGLKQHFRLPFTLRVFNTDTLQLVADINSDDTPSTSSSTAATATATATTRSAVDAAATQNAPAASRTPIAKISRFWDTYVWYHQGAEEPGRYRVELYANGILTHSIDYTVGTVPVPTPEAPPAPAFDVPAGAPTVQEAAPPPTVAPVVVPSRPQSAPVAAPVAVPPTPVPSPTPIPTPSKAYTTQVGGIPAGLDIDSGSGRFYVADASGVIWTTDAPVGQERPTLGMPFNIGPRAPVDLTIDQSTGYLYLSARACEPNAPYCILALDGRRGGSFLGSISLPAAPGEVRVDSELGLLYVVLPGRQALGEVDVRSGRLLQTIDGLPQITSLALDPLRHTLYAAHLGGQLTIIDVPSGQVMARPSLTGPGLASVATSRGLAYAVNTATHELAVLEPVSQGVIRYQLSQEPAAVAAAEDSGVVYVLSSRSNAILEIDPTDGTELGRVLVDSRSRRVGLGSAANVQTLRPKLVIDQANDGIYASLPEEGALAAVANTQFPVLARTIPYVDSADQAVANVIPGMVWPGADPASPQPAPFIRAQAPTSTDTNEEGI